MNAPKCEASDYIDFPVAAQRVFSCTEAARVQPVAPQAPAHDALTRLLHRLEPAELGAALRAEAAPQVRLQGGLLLGDTPVAGNGTRTHLKGYGWIKVFRRNHVAPALRAFVRLEGYCFHAGISWFEAKARIVRDAIRAYLDRPLYNLSSIA